MSAGLYPGFAVGQINESVGVSMFRRLIWNKYMINNYCVRPLYDLKNCADQRYSVSADPPRSSRFFRSHLGPVYMEVEDPR